MTDEHGADSLVDFVLAPARAVSEGNADWYSIPAHARGTPLGLASDDRYRTAAYRPRRAKRDQRRAVELMSGSPGKMGELQFEFWQHFSEALDGSSFPPCKPAARNWRYLPIGTGRAVVIAVVHFGAGRVGCKLAIRHSRLALPRDQAKVVYEGLFEDRVAIERELGSRTSSGVTRRELASTATPTQRSRTTGVGRLHTCG